jgi:ketosteroid isomerase-like protein
MSQENVELTKRLMAAWTRRDADDALEFLHEDIEWRPALTAGGLEGVVYRGKADMRKWFEELDDAWAELSVELAEFRDAGGNRVLQLGRFHAVGRASGVPVDQPQAILFTIVDGRVLTAQGFASHADALEAAGISE